MTKKSHYSTKSVRKSLFHFLGGKTVSSIASFAFAIILVRELTVIQYSSYTALTGLMILIQVLSSIGIPRLIPRYLSELRQAHAEAELRRLTWIFFYCRLAAFFIVLFILLLLNQYVMQWFDIQPEDDLFSVFAIFLTLFCIFNYLGRVHQAIMRQKNAALGSVIEAFIKLAGTILVISSSELSLTDVFSIQAVALLFASLYMGYTLHLNTRVSPEYTDRKHRFSRLQLILFARNDYFQSLVGFPYGASSRKLIGAAILTPYATAVLGFVHSITAVIERYLPATLLLGLIEPVIMARFSESRDFEQLSRYVSIVFKINVFILMPLLVWLCLDSRLMIELVTDGKYGDSGWLLSAFIFILITDSNRNMLQMVCNALESNQYLLSSNLWCLLFFPIVVLMTMQFEIAGMALSIIVIAFFRNTYVALKLRKHHGYFYKLDWPYLNRILLLSLITVVTNRYLVGLFDSSHFISILSLVFMTVLYLALAFFIKPFEASERDSINRLAGRKVFFW